MAKVSLTIQPTRPNRHGAHPVMLQISAHLKTILSPTDVTVKKEHWEKATRLVKSGKEGDPKAAYKNVRLTQIKNGCEVKMINNQERVDKMDVQALKKFLLSENEIVDTDFFSYCRARISEQQALGRKKSAELLQCTAEKINDFWGNSSLDFSEINIRFLQQFEAYCLRTKKKVKGKKIEKETEKTMSTNGVAVYLRNIRTILNQAIADDLTENYPFKKFKIHTEVTRNRNLSSEEIRMIRDYAAPDRRQEIARDFFLLQFFLLGINTFDIFWISSSGVVGNRLQFNRGKTGKFCNIKIEPEARTLIDKYRGQKYLLWFAEQSAPERTPGQSSKHARKSEFQYKDEAAFNKMINPNLAKIQTALKINPAAKITTYYTRHSMSSIMREIGVSVDDISLCLSHSSPEHKTTHIYINKDFERADIANRKLINHIQGIEEKATKSRARNKKD
jgi:site-specific recombinase XerD